MNSRHFSNKHYKRSIGLESVTSPRTRLAQEEDDDLTMDPGDHCDVLLYVSQHNVIHRALVSIIPSGECLFKSWPLIYGSAISVRICEGEKSQSENHL